MNFSYAGQHRPILPGDPAPMPPGESPADPQPSPRPGPDDDPPPVRAALSQDVRGVVDALFAL